MRLRPDQLSQALQKGLQRVYIVSGDELLLQQECSDAIRAACRQQGFSREVLAADNHFDWGELTASANAMSLFAERKLIELRLPSGKPGKVGGQALSDYCATASADNVLLIICNKIESTATKSKWYKSIESAGAAIQVWPIGAAELPQWLTLRLQQVGLRATSDAIEMIAERVEGNLLAGVQEIEKLRLFTDADTIDADTVANAVSSSARYDVFVLLDRCLQADARGSLRILQGLRAEGTETLAILWVVSRELRTLLQAAQQLEQGNGIDRVLQNLRIWDKRKALIKNALRRLNKPRLRQLLALANQVDQAAKGMNSANKWDLLEQLVMTLAGSALFSPRAEQATHSQ